jgi:hypothetical protein
MELRMPVLNMAETTFGNDWEGNPSLAEDGGRND